MSYVDEKIAKITLDNKAFTKNAEDTIKSLERLKQAFNKAGDVKAAKQVQKEMDSLSQSVGKSVQKSESMLSKLAGVFRKSTSNIDMSGASKSVDKMNTDIANKTAKTSDILSRLKGIFQKADTTDGFSNSISAVDKLNAKISTINASPIGQAFQSVAVQVQNSISIMDIALGNFIANAMTKMVGFTKQFMAGPIDGYAEYVNKMTSIQTIKSNTESAFGGDTNRQMIQINRTLSDLNEYADKTIYSFEDMTRNIGTFTAAGVGLEDSAVAIKGIANLAAASGSSSMQASTAMYQLSQALASGRVSLMDWNSVVNAGMGGELFKNALYDTADAMGIARDKTKTFRDSLQDGWITSEVLLETLKKFSTNESMIDAATKVKTFSQLIDTTKEAIGSGWSETWEHVFGGLEEAKGLWSDVAKSIGGYLDDNQGKFFDTTLQMERNLGNFRNAMLKTWKDNGGQKAFFEGIKSSVQGLMSVMGNFRQGWRDIMGDYKTQAAALVNVTNKFRDMTNAFRDNVKLQEASTLTRMACCSKGRVRSRQVPA
jgi:tape measure domain-containing protein